MHTAIALDFREPMCSMFLHPTNPVYVINLINITLHEYYVSMHAHIQVANHISLCK